MTTTNEWLAYFQSLQLDRLQDYMQRGCAHKDVTDEHLNQLWVIEFKQWSKNVGAKVDRRPQEDIEAELQLRGREPPFALVPEELKALMEASREESARLLRDPVASARAEQRLAEEIEQYSKDRRRKN
jgi:hypothetical protein